MLDVFDIYLGGKLFTDFVLYDYSLNLTPEQKTIANNSLIGISTKYLIENKGLKVCKLSELKNFLLNK